MQKNYLATRTNKVRRPMRAISSEILLRAIKEAMAKRKHMSLARLMKEYNELNDLKNHIETSDPNRWKPTIINFNSDPETLVKQQAELRRRAESNNAQDISHEEV